MWFHFAKILNLFWAVIAASAIVLLTPGALIALVQGEFFVALTCAMLVPIFCYMLLSMYFEHFLERRFRLSEEELLYLNRWSPIWGLNFNGYCLSRRRLLESKLSEPGSHLGARTIHRTRKLFRLHTVLMWAFYVDCAAVVTLVIVLTFTDFRP